MQDGTIQGPKLIIGMGALNILRPGAIHATLGIPNMREAILMIIDSALVLSLTMNPILDVRTHTQIMTNVFIVLQQVIYVVI